MRTCDICGSELECLAGRSAHPSNWYCRPCTTGTAPTPANNVRKFPGVPLTPRELIDKYMAEIDSAHSVAVVIRAKDGTLTTLWSDQMFSQLMYSARALNFDVERATFGGGSGDG